MKLLRELVVAFFHRRRSGERFYLNDLVGSVRMWRYVAPGSPERVMRDLRQKKVIDYRLVSRRYSLYEVRRYLKVQR